MKRISLLVFTIFVALVTYAQCDIAADIVDPDGYVNVRYDANSKADVVARLYSGTTVYYEYNSDSKWYRVSLIKAGTPLGYVHSSRLELETSSSPADYSDDASAFNIVVTEPGNILKYLPMDKLTQIKSITISGHMYETDIAIIKMCTNLQYLNMANATISESPESFERRKNDMFQSSDPLPDCYIPAEAFRDMRLKTVILPRKLKAIYHSAFKGCKSLKKIDLGEALVTIGGSAFENTQLIAVSFPKTLKEIYEDAFQNVRNLTILNLSHCAINEYLTMSGLNSNLGKLPDLETFYMPNGITTCAAFFFDKDNFGGECPMLKDFYVGKNVKSIDRKISNINLHFQSELAPEIGLFSEVSNCTIYVPKNGNITSYFAKFNGNGNKIIQEQ